MINLSRMTRGQQTALTCIVAGIVCEAALCIALHRWPPSTAPLGAGIGAAAWLFMIGPEADEYPSWFGVTLTVCTSIGVLITMAMGSA